MTIRESREQFHEKLCDMLGSRQVYFQPNNNTKIKYPAIVYFRSDLDNRRANNKIYTSRVRYSVTVIDKDPESPVIDKLNAFPLSSYDRHYVSDNLNHDVFTIYY